MGAIRDYEKEGTTPEAIAAEAQNAFQARHIAHERTLAQIAGVNDFIDSGGRAWGIKTFKIYEYEKLQSAILHLIYGIPAVDNFQYRVERAEVIQGLLINHVERPGLLLRLRRWLGLPDYSRISIYRHLIDGVAPTVLNAIIYSNFEKMSVKEFLETPKVAPMPGKTPITLSELMGVYAHCKNVLPKDYLEMTLPQLNQISEVADKESDEAAAERRINEAMKQYYGGQG